MKFNEKLINLRKKAGLSQEELGQKLNVTRQTVSKWELGQTTPEMDKLVEMGKLFNVSVDELINESEVTQKQNPTIEDQPIVDNKPKKSREKTVAIIIVVALVVAIILVVVNVTNSFANKKAENNAANQVTEQTTGLFDKIFAIFDKMFDRALENQEEITGQINATTEQMKVSAFNGPLQIYNGSNASLGVSSLLDGVVTSNKTQDKKITVKYDDIETQDENEILNVKSELDGNYEIIFDYDGEGYINKVTIKKVYTKMDIKIFNGPLEIFGGTKMGGVATQLIDDIITINKTKDRKITIKYGNTETQDETEIKNIKKKIDTFANYEITFDYDENGFINKATIEKI